MAVCDRCPAGDNEVPSVILADHVKLMHGDGAPSLVAAAEVAGAMSAARAAGPCSHMLEGVTRAYWILRELASEWVGSDVYRALKRAAESDTEGTTGAAVDLVSYRAYLDGLEAACDAVYTLGLRVDKEARS